ncbi:MAG: hypothetical protein PHQ23_10555 [Candidatus Wallbacteria bacterium]|nr:hypothetical protein [Candidatus Wallbacteria bacterium]
MQEVSTLSLLSGWAKPFCRFNNEPRIEDREYRNRLSAPCVITAESTAAFDLNSCLTGAGNDTVVAASVANTIRNKLLSLSFLSDNWDGYGAKPISSQAVSRAAMLVDEAFDEATPVPSVVPVPNGSVQLEWHENNVDLEIEFLSSNKLLVSFDDLDEDISWEKVITDDYTALVQALNRLATHSG